MQHSDYLVFIFLYILVMFLTAFTGRILYKRSFEKPAGIRMQKLIYLICGLGMLALLLYWIFSHIPGVRGQIEAYATPFLGSQLFISHSTFLLLSALILYEFRLFRPGEFKFFLFIAAMLLLTPVLQITFTGLAIYNFMTFIVIITITLIYRWETADSTIFRKDVYLTAANIDMLSVDTDVFLKEIGVSSRMMITVRLKVEETLLRMQEKFGENAKLDFYTVVVFGKPSIRFALAGVPFNPLAESDTEVSDWSMEMLRGTTVSPRFLYFFGKNHIKLALPKQKTNPALKIIVYILVGLIFGVTSVISLSQEELGMLTEHVLDPAYDLLINILSCAAGPIIFFMVINTILNTGAISNQGISSGNIVGRYFSLSGGMAAIAVTLMCLFSVDAISSHRPGNEEILEFLEKATYLVPESIFDPITEANTPQLLVLAIVLGCAVVSTGRRGNTLTDLLRQSNLVGMRIAEWIGRLVPYFAVLIVAYFVVMAQMSEFWALGRMLVAAILISSVCAAGAVLYVSRTRKMRAGVILKKCRASLKYAFKTGSAYTAYDASEECCINELGNWVSESPLPWQAFRWGP